MAPLPDVRARVEAAHSEQKPLQRREFLLALQELEKAKGTEPRSERWLCQLFDGIERQKALKFHENHEGRNSELAFGRSSQKGDLEALWDWFVEQNLEVLLEAEEEKQVSLLSSESQKSRYQYG